MMDEFMEIGFDNVKIGEVRDNYDPTGCGEIKVYVPELMEVGEWDEQPKNFPSIKVPNSHIKNEHIYQTGTVQTRNYFTVKPIFYVEDNWHNGEPVWKYNHDYTNGGIYNVPRVGQKILIWFQNGDPQKGYYLPLTLTVTGETIEPRRTHSPNWSDPVKKPNITSYSFWNGNIIEMDTNEDNNAFTFSIVDDPSNLDVKTKNNKDGQYKFEMLHSSEQKREEIKISTPKDSFIQLNDKNGQEEIIINFNNINNDNSTKISIKDNLIILKTPDGSKVTLQDGNINLHAPGNININAGGNITLSGQRIDLN